jgi:hypothetical protein
MSKHQNIKLANYQIIKIPKHQNTKISKYQNTKMSKYENTKIPKYQNIKIPKYQNIKTSKYGKMARQIKYWAIVDRMAARRVNCWDRQNEKAAMHFSIGYLNKFVILKSLNWNSSRFNLNSRYIDAVVL